nr:MAG: cobalt-precorrin-6A synthase [Thermoproteus sp. AZ2]
MLTLKRFGITTGAAAAAAAKAAALYARGVAASSVTIPTPIGLRLEVAVERQYSRGGVYCAEVRKFSGDNPDVLDGALFRVCVEPGEGGLVIKCGEGVGRVTRPGLPVPPGECAINPVPRAMIVEALKEAGFVGGVVLVEVPGGEELAKLTMNEDVGVVGGISILGTTGIEMPMSDEEYPVHLEAELKAVGAAQRDKVVLAFGNKATEFAKLRHGDVVVKIGDWVGYAVEMAAEMGFGSITVAGLPAKLVKVAAGAMNTHSKYCDARLETLTYAAAAAGVPYDYLLKIISAKSVAEALAAVAPYKRAILEVVARRAAERLRRYVGREVHVEVYLEDGEVAAVA